MSQPVIDRLNYHATHRGGLFRSSGRLVEQRIKAIRRHVDFQGKTVLDLGCSGGYFSLNIAQEAKRVLGVDGDREVIEQNIAVAHRMGIKNVEFINARLTPQLISALPDFDVVLFLSVFHHMLAASDAYGWNSEASRSEAFDALQVIRDKARVLVFEMGYPDEGYDWSSKLPPMEPDPVTWIKSCVFGDEYSVQLLSPPVLMGPLGRIRRWVLENRHRNGLLRRLLRRLLNVDVRDQRHLFIGIKRS